MERSTIGELENEHGPSTMFIPSKSCLKVLQRKVVILTVKLKNKISQVFTFLRNYCNCSIKTVNNLSTENIEDERHISNTNSSNDKAKLNGDRALMFLDLVFLRQRC